MNQTIAQCTTMRKVMLIQGLEPPAFSRDQNKILKLKFGSFFVFSSPEFVGVVPAPTHFTAAARLNQRSPRAPLFGAQVATM